MKTLSLKLDDLVYQETEQLLDKIKKPRNRYINEALLYYNRIQKKKIIAKILEAESLMVSKESLKILTEFENIDEYDY
ncbi:MAG: hypothetical protein NTZ33_05925 [Bacteroidetes bacterium]|nr:hypothetical protein [Bacteroidota bacterium]